MKEPCKDAKIIGFDFVNWRKISNFVGQLQRDRDLLRNSRCRDAKSRVLPHGWARGMPQKKNNFNCRKIRDEKRDPSLQLS